MAALTGVAAHDLLQRRHAILRNFPVIGHARYLIEKLGPELRQYVVAGNDEERPFSRDQRRWVHASTTSALCAGTCQARGGHGRRAPRADRLPVGGDPHGQSATPLDEVYGYDPGWGYPSAADRADIASLMRATAPRGGPTSGEATEEVRIPRSAVS